MRDTFLLLWVGFLLIGVIGSIVSSARKQAQRAQAVQPPRRIPPQWQPPQPAQAPSQRVIVSATPSAPKRVAPSPSAPRGIEGRRTPVVPKPAAAPAPADEPLHDLHVPQHRTHRFFRSRQAIVQAVIAAEVLGKPRALRDEYL